MASIMYLDQGTMNQIPSDLYLDVPDYAKILEDIATGKLPSGTNQPFALFSQFDNDRIDPTQIPWETSGPTIHL